jgi:predicted RNase H-like HicB family nuclease
MKKYGFSVFWSEEDGGYIATCPDFPGLSAFGESPEEAIQQASSALEGFVETLAKDDTPLPEPTVVPEFSGQLRLRLPRNLHKELTERARLENMSLNSYIVHLLSDRNATEKLVHEVVEHFEKIRFVFKIPPKEIFEPIQPRDQHNYQSFNLYSASEPENLGREVAHAESPAVVCHQLFSSHMKVLDANTIEIPVFYKSGPIGVLDKKKS